MNCKESEVRGQGSVASSVIAKFIWQIPCRTYQINLVLTKTAVLIFYLLTSCYTFKSTGIPPNVNTFYVAEFDNNTANVVPTLSYDFSQALLDKVLRESTLTYTEIDPDVEFSGYISRYQVTSVAPTERDGLPTTSFNRLDIGVQVDYLNNREEDATKKEWSQQFSFYLDYESTENLLDIQEDLIQQINDQLVEDIFNRAFSDW